MEQAPGSLIIFKVRTKATTLRCQEILFLAGSCPELGNWCPNKAIELNPSPDEPSTWITDLISFPFGIPFQWLSFLWFIWFSFPFILVPFGFSMLFCPFIFKFCSVFVNLCLINFRHLNRIQVSDWQLSVQCCWMGKTGLQWQPALPASIL